MLYDDDGATGPGDFAIRGNISARGSFMVQDAFAAGYDSLCTGTIMMFGNAPTSTGRIGGVDPL